MKAALAIATLLAAQLAAHCAQANPEPTEGSWAIGTTTRLWSSPYLGEDTRVDFLPEIYYRGQHAYLDGTRGGWRNDLGAGLALDLFGRYRFGGYDADTTPELDGMRRSGTLEAGASLTQQTGYGDFSLTLAADTLNRHQGETISLAWAKEYRYQDWSFEPTLALDYDSAQVNDYYYGVKPQEAQANRPAYAADSSLNLRAGVKAWYRIAGAHLLGFEFSHTEFGAAVGDSPITDADAKTELAFQYRYEFLNHPAQQLAASAADSRFFKGEWEWRLAHGYWTDGNFIEMIYLNQMASDRSNTSFLSGFLSKKISDEAWGLPVQTYLTGGLVRHFEQDVQDDFNEYVFAVKGYFNRFPWSHKIETRVGFGYGFSYGAKVPWQESESVLEDNDNDSRLMQYLDYSWDLNLGDLFNADGLKHCYGGYAIHHRSGIFGKSEVYNGVQGGSNWNTFYLQCKVR